MAKCVDCDNESMNPNGWYVDYTYLGKQLRCQFCGEKEQERRIGLMSPKTKHLENMQKDNKAEDMRNCLNCNCVIDPDEIYGDWFHCLGCGKNFEYHRKRLSPEDVIDNVSDSPTLAEMQGDAQK